MGWPFLSGAFCYGGLMSDKLMSSRLMSDDVSD